MHPVQSEVHEVVRLRAGNVLEIGTAPLTLQRVLGAVDDPVVRVI
jgi:hypothetical protein